ncbi:CRTAC1 family protein [uncultured Lacinutrix sp.]|uniref:CRTAC1 family protein n=1 Tax=uncultured Lacinutrix sp. TaxID=574032 RepID=UPI002623643D|nr:CRTAC1 family protein [uncultured Lacinutrix sp.]
MKRQLLYIVSLFYILFSVAVTAQQDNSISNIIEKINILEKEKDPKCYATANRLEDFMYGTPLDEDARNLKIEIQKTLILHLKREGTKNAIAAKSKTIRFDDLKPTVNSISRYKRDTNGDFLYQYGTGYIPISKLDFDQYSSVSYAYRSILSVEQDLLFIPEESTLPFDIDVIQSISDYINLVTLVVLKIADNTARKNNHSEINKTLIKNSWIAVLKQSKEEKITKLVYPKLKNTEEAAIKNNAIIKDIIKQKLESYNTYNAIITNVFLRNIQVYFARQKWPVEKTISDQLKNYYIESLVQFSNSLLKEANKTSTKNQHTLIRVSDIQLALSSFLPYSTNAFEDVLFFPNNALESINIESYDLDAYRDSGIHWKILEYSINDLNDTTIKNLDPNAAELVVEGIAQLGVLTLRIAGEISHEKEKKALDNKDIEASFAKVQKLINSYSSYKKQENNTNINSSNTTNNSNEGFIDVSQQANILFEHKSSDWLSRHIRSYSTNTEEKEIKLTIPPAFGGSGVACEDINNDGLVDVLLLSGFGNKLYLNTKNNRFIDVTKKSKLNHWNAKLNSYGEPRQPIIADFNNDGLQDIFITYVNDSHKLYKNINGTQFEDVSASSDLKGENAVAGPATAFDYNNDGLLDIFIGYFGNYIDGILPTLSRDNKNGSPNKLYKNLGNFTFEEVTFTENSNFGWTQAVGHSDINQDGLQDLIVGNDFGVNKYYYNTGDGLFKEVSKQLGTDKPSYSMNIGITDLNKDLYPDFYISNIVVMQKDEKYVSPNADTQMKFDSKKMTTMRTIEANDLFLSQVENKEIKHYKLSTNIGRGYSATGWSWDADFFDYDNDGDEDLYCLNGMNDFSVYASENPFYFERKSESVFYAKSNREKNVFFVNENNTLTNKAETLGLAINSNSRSASYLDYDNDGDLDIIINNYHDSANLLENKIENSSHWIKIKLIGNINKKINRDAIGSTLILNSKHHKNIWREIHSTTGYLSGHPKMQHFGLGEDNKVDITVKWSNGESYLIEDVIANNTYLISYPNTLTKQ